MKTLKYILSLLIILSFSANSFSDILSEKEIDKILKAAEKYNKKNKYKPPKPFRLYDAGTDKWIDYEKYGEFKDLGTVKYKYVSLDSEGLRKASGEGIYPNTKSVLESPAYKKLAENNKLKGDHWSFVNTHDYQANFYKWATTREDPGVKLYFTGVALDRAGHYEHAIKAYYACLVFFPKAVGWTEFKTPWYIGPVCIDRIKFLTRKYPALGVKLEGAEIIIENAFDNDIRNDVFHINPGKLVPAKAEDFERKYIDLEKVAVKNTVGTGKCKLIEYENGHFQMQVDNKPFFIRGMTYNPNKVGLSPETGLQNNIQWTYDDYDNNGRIDGPFDAWVDTNRNEIQDKHEKRIGDFSLMKAMGINTLRIYHHRDINKELLKEGYEKYGFMYLMGDFVGMYAVDSGATWEDGTNYKDPQQKENMLNSIRRMVEEYKDEPYVLMWVLGNENNYSNIGESKTSSKVYSQPEDYYGFANECAKLIKSLDPHKRPVAISNGDLGFFNYFVEYCPDIDIYGANSYRGEQGFGNMWKDVKNLSGKPLLITEFGCPAYAEGWTTARMEAGQASYHQGAWRNIEDHKAGVIGGYGNSLGGIIFEWTDEWWKSPGKDPSVHNREHQFGGAFLDGKGYEEWFGICGIGEDGKDSTFKRYLRETYFMYKDLWEQEK